MRRMKGRRRAEMRPQRHPRQRECRRRNLSNRVRRRRRPSSPQLWDEIHTAKQGDHDLGVMDG